MWPEMPSVKPDAGPVAERGGHVHEDILAVFPVGGISRDAGEGIWSCSEFVELACHYVLAPGLVPDAGVIRNGRNWVRAVPRRRDG